jgi:TolB-like protein
LLLKVLLILGFLMPPAGVLAGQAASPVPRPSAAGGREGVVVFPFENISGHVEDDWIGAGLAETLVADLAASGTLTVIGPEVMRDALRRRGAGPDAADGRLALDVSRDLGAAWLVIGGYQRLGALVRVTARIVDVRTGDVAVTAKVDGLLDEIFRLQDRVAAALDFDADELSAVRRDRPVLNGATADGDTPPPAVSARSVAPDVAPPELRERSTPGSAGSGASRATAVEAPTPPPAPAAAAAVTGTAAPSAARETAVSGVVAAAARLEDFEGPPPPVPPAVITRDNRGSATVRAVRIDRPLNIDGRLDEELYRIIPAASGFIQQEPHEGEPATEQTDTWVLFDDRNVYIVARCWDSQPERMVMNEMRRDMGAITQNENFSVVLDTFHDRRNGFFFQTTPLGAIRDQTFTDEGNQNTSWNTIWEAKTARFENGWTLELEIPFKSLRYKGAGPQVWGINFRRMVRWKNEESYLTQVSAGWGNLAVFHVSAAGTLVGLETPAQSVNLEVKPYLAGTVTTDRVADDPFSNRLSRNAGFDFKYGLTRSLIADATINTDFAQIEEDVQQVNLTRFSLFFPEKRDFFLEGQGTFAFGTPIGATALVARGGGDAPTLFFSRRVGLSEGQSVPIIAGGRLNGTVGKFTVGALSIQTDDKPLAGAVATNFSAFRLKRSILRRSNIGVIATNRTPTADGIGSNQAFGVDANFGFFAGLTVSSYYARTRDENGLAGDASSYRGRFEFASDRYGVSADHLMVGDRFNPEIGFVARSDFRRSTATARFSPRPASSRIVRRSVWESNFDYITDSRATRVENRQITGIWRLEFTNSDIWNIDYTRDFEFLPDDFEIADGVLVPTGAYNYQTVTTGYTFGQHRRLSGRLLVRAGTFYEGEKQEVTFTFGRASLSSRLNIEPGLSLNWVDLPQGSFKTRLMTARAIFTPSPRSLVSALFQYNAVERTLSSSVRLRWEYTGGSELFVVYSDNRNTPNSTTPGLLNRSVAVKITRLVRF